MNVATRKIEEWFKEKKLNYELQEGDEDNNDIFIIPCSLENINSTKIIASIGDDDIQMFMLNIIKVPDNKEMTVIKKLNELNCKYRWVKLQMDSGYVSVNVDATFGNDSLIAIWDNLLCRITSITDDCYPEIMKVLWI